jgi:transcriptional regulator with XRE-family HTH domain
MNINQRLDDALQAHPIIKAPVVTEATKTAVKAKFQAELSQSDISQVDLADRLDVDESTISRYKTGKRLPSLRKALQLEKEGIDVFGIWASEPESHVKPVKNRAKSAASKVSGQMRDASEQAQVQDAGREPENVRH